MWACSPGFSIRDLARGGAAGAPRAGDDATRQRSPAPASPTVSRAPGVVRESTGLASCTGNRAAS